MISSQLLTYNDQCPTPNYPYTLSYTIPLGNMHFINDVETGVNLSGKENPD